MAMLTRAARAPITPATQAFLRAELEAVGVVEVATGMVIVTLSAEDGA